MCIATNELIGYVVGGFVFESFKSKPATNLYLISYTICLVGSLGIILNNEEESPWLDLIFTFISKFGIAMAFQGVYLANVLFPIVFSSTTFGICCMMGSTAAFGSVFQIYNFEDKSPVALFGILSVVGFILALLQKEK